MFNLKKNYADTPHYRNLQPLRIEGGWRVGWNTLYVDLDPNAGDLGGSTIFYAVNEGRRFVIDVMFRPEFDPNGRFIIEVTYVPYLRTDFIYSAIAQELGLIGAAALLLCAMLVVVRGMRIAIRAQDGFSKLLAAGLTFGFALQTFIIVGGVLRVVPLTGITLPFVSYGGTSIVVNFLALALLLLVSNRANAPR